MGKKNNFINLVETLLTKTNYEAWDDNLKAQWADAIDYWNAFKATGETDKPKFTENGKLVLKFMIDSEDDFNNFFKAKDIGERIAVSSRTVSGALRKLVTDGYVEKVGGSPTVYILTEKGEKANFDEE